MPKWHRSYTRETQTAAHEQYSKCKLPHVQHLLGGERAAICQQHSMHLHAHNHVHCCMPMHAEIGPPGSHTPVCGASPRAEPRHAQNPTRQAITLSQIYMPEENSLQATSNHQPSDVPGLWLETPNTRHCVSIQALAPAISQWPTRLAHHRVQRIPMRRARTSIEYNATSTIQP